MSLSRPEFRVTESPFQSSAVSFPTPVLFLLEPREHIFHFGGILWRVVQGFKNHQFTPPSKGRTSRTPPLLHSQPSSLLYKPIVSIKNKAKQKLAVLQSEMLILPFLGSMPLSRSHWWEDVRAMESPSESTIDIAILTHRCALWGILCNGCCSLACSWVLCTFSQSGLTCAPCCLHRK